jgi:hypothetical protein
MRRLRTHRNFLVGTPTPQPGTPEYQAIEKSSMRLMEVYKQCFLRELAKGKSPTHAAQVAGLARSTAYLFRSQDPEFARQWLEASAEGVERLENVCQVKSPSPQ